MPDLTPEIDFIRDKFNWDDPRIESVISNLSTCGISVSDLAEILGISEDEARENIESRPMLKTAFLAGPKLADAQIANKIYEKALTGDLKAGQFWLTNKLSTSTLAPGPVIKDSDDPVKFFEDNVSILVKKGFQLALESNDLSKINSFIHTVMDRVYGKPTEKVEMESTHRYVIMGVEEAPDALAWQNSIIEHKENE